MSASFVRHYDRPVSGVAVTRYGHGGDIEIPGVEVIEAGHPIPDENSIRAGNRALALARSAQPGDRVVVLLSGGASALLESPRPGVDLERIVVANRALLNSGASIHEINVARRRMSAIKGGGLARAAAPADTFVFAISDVPGDRIEDIGSGPCHPDDGPAVELATAQIVACGADAIAAAAAAAAAAGFEPVNLGADIGGPARQVAAEHARLALELAGRDGRFAIVSGGETTVRVRNPKGRGGRNSEYALALAIGLNGARGIHALAADTDGIDGTEANAGAFVLPDTMIRGIRAGLSAPEFLDANRSYDYFDALNDLFVTGPTLTNVNDLRVILID